MKKALKILRIISTIIGAFVLTFFIVGSIIWGVDAESFEYARNPLVSNENLDNEGPFIFEKDSIYQINYIKENSKTPAIFSIYDLSGEKLKSGVLSPNNSIGISRLSKGTYMLYLSVDGVQKIEKFIKNWGL